MPTGFTAPLYEGEEISFEEFMLRCSRSMGATILLRDHPLSVAPTEENVVEGDFYAKRLAEKKDERARVSGLDAAAIAAEHLAETEERIRANAERVAECRAIRERYEAMLSQAEAWVPPTDSHAPLKEFVLQQLRESIDWDAKPYVESVEDMTDERWQTARLERLDLDVERAKAEIAKVEERNRGRTEWVKALRASLSAVPA